MDYSKVPLAKRTRHQEELFFKRYNEGKKKAKSGESNSVSGEKRAKIDRVRVEGFSNSGSVRDIDSGSVGVSDGGKSGLNLGDVSVGKRGKSDRSVKKVNSKIGLERGKSSVDFDVGREKNGESEKGLKEIENVVEIKVGLVKNQNVVPIDVDLEAKKRELERLEAELEIKRRELESLEKSRNAVGVIDLDDDDGEEEEEEEEEDVDGAEGGVVLPVEVVQSNSSSSKRGLKQTEDCAAINVGDAVSFSEEMAERSDGLKIDDGRSMLLEVGTEEKSAEDNDVHVELNDSESSSEEDTEESSDEDTEYSSDVDMEETSDEDFIVYNLDTKGNGGDEDEDEEESEDEPRVVEGESVCPKVKEKVKRREVSSGCVVILEQLKHSYSMDDEGNDGSGCADGEGMERREGGLKRKNVFGSDDSLDCSKENKKEVTGELKGVAKRLRSQSKKPKGEGTFISPVCVDMDVEDNDFAVDGNTCSHNASNVKRVRKYCKKGKLKIGNHDIVKILANSILEHGDEQLEDLVSDHSGQEDPPAELPLKFRFDYDDPPPPPEKSESEKEIDGLFEELNLCLAVDADTSMDGNIDNITTETEIDPTTLCHKGVHQLRLDEEMGLTCEFCSHVELERKYILPPFSTHPWGNRDKRHFVRSDGSIFDELQFQSSGCENQYGLNGSVNAKGTVWDIIPGVKNTMYPHQQEGFEFIWNNIAGGIHLEKLKKPAFDGGSGVIISHAPGTGKTRLTIVFLQTYLELFPACRPVIIAPRSMLLTWEEEFRKWNVNIPFHNLNKTEYSGQENLLVTNLVNQVAKHERSLQVIRMAKLYSWKKDRSILGLSYRLFEQLVGDCVEVDRGCKEKRKVQPCSGSELVKKILLELPSLLVLDEGHTPRNKKSLIWKALSKIETHRRIILSGTPFQNNFGELYNTLCLVRPKFADRITSESNGDFRKKRGRKPALGKGNWASLTSSIGKDANDRLEELRAMIDPFVHVHKGYILQERLPGLRDSLVVLKPTPLQKVLLKGLQGMKNPLDLTHLVSLISVHPKLVPDKYFSETKNSSVDKNDIERLKFDPDDGVKTTFLMKLIMLSEALNERVLVFSQYIDPLTFIMNQLKSQFDWTEGKEMLFMDGKIDSKPRQSSISVFNDPTSEARVLFASTRACSEGINLVGASRVVLLDVVWNPSVERQAISRAYRIGQKKVVHIYHLITSGTMEGDIYVRQAEKDRLSELIFSSTDWKAHEPQISSTVSEDKILEAMVNHDKLKGIFEKIHNQPKELHLIETFGLVDL